jgi:hypothetical protein
MRLLRPVVLVAVVTSSLLGLTSCGDDEDDGASSAFCDIARKLNDSEGFPPEEQMDRYVTLAPGAIKDDAELAIEALKEDAEQAYDDPEVVEAVSRIEEFEAEECDIRRP